jgi:LysR family transcriptional regulator, glycine cleavage system transcriptional activator
VAVRFGHFNRAGLRCQRLWFDRMVAVASPAWVALHGTVPAQWPAKQLLRHSYEPWPQRLTQPLTVGANSKLPLAEGFEFNDTLLLVHAVLMGCGIAWVRSSLVERLLAEGHLQVLAQSEQLADKAVWLVCREDTAEMPAVREFWRWALSLVGSTQSSGRRLQA